MKKFDIYPQTINFTVNGNPKFKTAIGGLLTIIMLIVFVVLIINFSHDLVYKLNPSLYQQTITDQDQFINMNSPFINIIFQPYKKKETTEYIIDSSYFNFVVENITYTKNSDGNLKVSEDIVGLKKCNISDFDESLHDYFRINNFNNSLCIARKNFEIGGVYSSDIFKFLRIYVKECNGIDYITGEKIKCKSREEIIKEISIWKLSMYFSYAISNPSNYTQPYQTKIYNKGYVFNPGSLVRENFYFSDDIVNTNDDLILTNEGYNNSIPNYATYDSTIAHNELENLEVELEFFKIYFRTHSSYDHIKRVYKKLPEILAGTLSVIEVYNFFVIALYPLYNVVPFKLWIINSKFHNANGIEINLRNKLKQLFNIQNIKIDSKMLNSPKKYTKTGEKVVSSKENIKSEVPSKTILSSEVTPMRYNFNMLSKDYLDNINKFSDNKKNKIYPFSLVFSLIFCQKNRKTAVFHHFNELINRRLEFNSYLNIFDELEQIKGLILDENQYCLFDQSLKSYSIQEESIINSNWLEQQTLGENLIIEAVRYIKNKKDKNIVDVKLLNSLQITK